MVVPIPVTSSYSGASPVPLIFTFIGGLTAFRLRVCMILTNLFNSGTTSLIKKKIDSPSLFILSALNSIAPYPKETISTTTGVKSQSCSCSKTSVPSIYTKLPSVFQASTILASLPLIVGNVISFPSIMRPPYSASIAPLERVISYVAQSNPFSPISYFT